MQHSITIIHLPTASTMILQTSSSMHRSKRLQTPPHGSLRDSLRPFRLQAGQTQIPSITSRQKTFSLQLRTPPEQFPFWFNGLVLLKTSIATQVEKPHSGAGVSLSSKLQSSLTRSHEPAADRAAGMGEQLRSFKH